MDDVGSFCLDSPVHENPDIVDIVDCMVWHQILSILLCGAACVYLCAASRLLEQEALDMCTHLAHILVSLVSLASLVSLRADIHVDPQNMINMLGSD